ncbi:MAG: tyrosine-type recombinase/integrase [Xanthobacteraceae bacterium]
MIAHLRVVEPRNENRTVPVRPSNDDLRPREYLTPGEVETLIKAARDGRYGHRDATLILVAYRHGLRAIEICDLEWSQVEFGRNATLHVRRAKNGKPAAHPIRGDELRALHKLKAETDTAPTSSPPNAAARFRQTPSIGLSSALVRVRGCRSPVHVHMLRHACGYKLANDGHDTRAIQDWLGHRSIQHTARYTELSQQRFKDFWRD